MNSQVSNEVTNQLSNQATNQIMNLNYQLSEFNYTPNLDNLPLELYQFILQYLDLVDVLNLRVVSKRFNFIVSEFKVNELIFFNCNDYYNKFNWFYLNRPINFKNLINESKLFLLFAPLINIQSLKYLKIVNLQNSKLIHLDELNQLDQLVHLEIELKIFKNENWQRNSRLALPNLKSLCLGLQNYADEKIVIETPKLTGLYLVYESDINDLFEFSYPSMISHLKLRNYHNDVSLFLNIEYLDCIYGSTIDFSSLSRFARLKEVRISSSFRNRLSESKSGLRNDVKILFSGIELIDGNEFNRFKSDRIVFEAQINHFKRLAVNLNYPIVFDYSYLTKHLANSIAVELNKKFINIQQIKVDRKIEDQSKFSQFVKQCANLSVLSLKHSILPQSFYGELASISSLNSLEINEIELKLNYEFIHKIHHLIKFKTNQQLHLNEKHALDQLVYLKSIEFVILSNEIAIAKLTENNYKFKKNEIIELPKEKMNFKQLISWCTCLNDRP